MTLAFRHASDSDKRFCADAWSRTYRTAESAGFIDMRHWLPIAVEQCKRYIARSYVTTIIAYEDAEWARAADIYGFIVADTTDVTPLLYMGYVKDEYRRRGFARALFAAAGIDPTARFSYLCETRSSEALTAAGKMPHATFDPVPIRTGRKELET